MNIKSIGGNRKLIAIDSNEDGKKGMSILLEALDQVNESKENGLEDRRRLNTKMVSTNRTPIEHRQIMQASDSNRKINTNNNNNMDVEGGENSRKRRALGEVENTGLTKKIARSLFSESELPTTQSGGQGVAQVGKFYSYGFFWDVSLPENRRSGYCSILHSVKEPVQAIPVDFQEYQMMEAQRIQKERVEAKRMEAKRIEAKRKEEQRIRELNTIKQYTMKQHILQQRVEPKRIEVKRIEEQRTRELHAMQLYRIQQRAEEQRMMKETILTQRIVEGKYIQEQEEQRIYLANGTMRPEPKSIVYEFQRQSYLQNEFQGQRYLQNDMLMKNSLTEASVSKTNMERVDLGFHNKQFNVDMIINLIRSKYIVGKHEEVEDIIRLNLRSRFLLNQDRIVLFTELSFACAMQKKYAEAEEAALNGLGMVGCRDEQKVHLNLILSSVYFEQGTGTRLRALISIVKAIDCLGYVRNDALKESVFVQLSKLGTFEEIFKELVTILDAVRLGESNPSKEEIQDAVQVLGKLL